MECEGCKKLEARITRIENTLARLELALSSAAAKPGLDPDQVALEDQRLLDAEKTLPTAEYKALHVEIMAGRLEKLGNYSAALRMKKTAIRLCGGPGNTL